MDTHTFSRTWLSKEEDDSDNMKVSIGLMGAAGLAMAAFPQDFTCDLITTNPIGDWTDPSTSVATIPGKNGAGGVTITVTNDNGASSAPYTIDCSQLTRKCIISDGSVSTGSDIGIHRVGAIHFSVANVGIPVGAEGSLKTPCSSTSLWQSTNGYQNEQLPSFTIPDGVGSFKVSYVLGEASDNQFLKNVNYLGSYHVSFPQQCVVSNCKKCITSPNPDPFKCGTSMCALGYEKNSDGLCNKNICTKSGSNCNLCGSETAAANCIKCNGSLNLDNGKCCPENCATCDAEFKCTVAAAGYAIASDATKSCTKINCGDNCKTCHDATTCKSDGCEDGYAPSTDSNNKVTCPTPYVCADTNCDLCSGTAPSSCLTCADGYYGANCASVDCNADFPDNSCQTCNTNNIALCDTCDTEYARSSDGTACTKYTCNAADKCALNQCSGTTAGLCTACGTGSSLCLTCGSSYKGPELGVCSAKCADNCDSCSDSNTCSGAASGYTIVSAAPEKNECTKSGSNCNLCGSETAAASCIACKSGYAGKACTQITCDSITQCSVCAETNKCGTCNDGYEGDSCTQIQCNDATGGKCAVCKSANECLNCEAGTTLENGNCVTKKEGAAGRVGMASLSVFVICLALALF